jgi:effector-binding domain-containing protein
MGGLGQEQQNLSGSSVETESEADFWPLLQQTLESIVGTGAGRGVIINAQTGTVLVRAMPRELREIRQYLETVQSSAQRMVVLEAKVIEVELRDGFESGINWAAIARSGSRSIWGGVLRGQDLFEGSPLAGQRIPTSSGGVVDLDSRGFGGAFGVGIDTRDFNAFIELLETQGRTQVLSSPRVSAVNNQKSVIKVGSDEFFVTSIGAQTTVGTAATTSNMVQLTPFFSGIALDVTPQISGQGEVILHIQPTVSEVRDQTKRLPVSGGQQPVDVPLAFKDEVWVRSHYDTITVQVPDAPLADELVVIAAVADLRPVDPCDPDLDFVVWALVGLWWSDRPESFITRDKDEWQWRLLISQPDWITDDAIADAQRTAQAKKGAEAISHVRRETLREGTCAQALHIGPFDDEGPALAKLHDEYLAANILRMTGPHHEIYLSDRRRTAPAKLRTILRQPVEAST